MYVGGDAYIAPWGTNEFALDFHKNGLYRRVDVGIDPYAGPKNYRNPVGADDPVRPQKIDQNVKSCGEFATSQGWAESPAPTT